MEDVIVGCPFPGIDQRGDLGQDIAVGGDDPRGFAGCTTGVKDHGPPIQRDLGNRAFLGLARL